MFSECDEKVKSSKYALQVLIMVLTLYSSILSFSEYLFVTLKSMPVHWI
jgi:hypothetical protein